MDKQILLGLIAIVAFRSQIAHGSTGIMYNKISSIFNSGTKPKLDQYVDKLISGRCFDKNEPDSPQPGYVVISKVSSQGGPLGEDTFVGDEFWTYNNVPDAFDRRSFDDYMKMTGKKRTDMYPFKLNGNMTYYMKVTGNEIPGAGYDDFELRYSGNYLVSKIREHGQYETTLFCYYFN